MHSIVDEYKTDMSKNAARPTLVGYCSDVKEFLSYLDQKNIDITQCSPDTVQQFINGIIGKRKPSTIMRKSSAVRSFIAWAVKTGKTPPNPLYKKPLTLPKNTISYVRQFGAIAIEKIYAKTRNHKQKWKARRDMAIMALIEKCGLKVGELTRLTFRDGLKLTEGYSAIDPNNNPRILRIGKVLKRRIVKVDYETRKAVYDYTIIRYKLTANSDPEFALFLNRFGRPLSQRSVRRNMENYACQAGVDIINPSILRNTLAIKYMNSGKHISYVKKELGMQTETIRFIQASCLRSSNAENK